MSAVLLTEPLRAYAEDRGLLLLTRAEFGEGVFLPTAWDRRGLIIGHNFPFDLGAAFDFALPAAGPGGTNPPGRPAAARFLAVAEEIEQAMDRYACLAREYEHAGG